MRVLKRRAESFYRGMEWRAISLEINVTDNSYIDALSTYIFYIEFRNECELHLDRPMVCDGTRVNAGEASATGNGA